MTRIIELLSGSIPGGIILLSLALLFGNLTIYFLRSSGLLTSRVREKYILVNTFFIVVYALIWGFTKPIPPPERIVVLPTQTDSSFTLNPASLELAEMLQEKPALVRTKFIIHKWEWLYETLGKDSVSFYQSWYRLGRNLNPRYLIQSYRSGEMVILNIFGQKEIKPQSKSFPQADFPHNALSYLQAKLNLYGEDMLNFYTPKPIWLSAKVEIAAHRYDGAISLLKSDSSAMAKVIAATAWVGKGLRMKIDRIKRQYVKIINPDFEKAKGLLNTLVRQRKNLPGIAFLLGRMAIREERYNDADIFLKKALVDDPRDARTYYQLSFLLNERLQEIGYANRMEIVEQAIQFDPAYTQAVYDLANTYYTSGTGLENGSGTMAARKTLMRFLKLQNKDPKILSMLATIDMKIKRYDDAQKIFTELNRRFPNDSNGYYNLGILYFAQQEYDSAFSSFKKAIKIDNNKDAILYAGLTAERLGKKNVALAYYRNRVKLSTSEDDKYAREAMKGIRHVLRSMQKDSTNPGNKM